MSRNTKNPRHCYRRSPVFDSSVNQARVIVYIGFYHKLLIVWVKTGNVGCFGCKVLGPLHTCVSDGWWREKYSPWSDDVYISRDNVYAVCGLISWHTLFFYKDIFNKNIEAEISQILRTSKNKPEPRLENKIPFCVENL